MNFKDVERITSAAISRFLSRDKYLLEHDVNERSITHKLAEYLQDEVLDGYHVDCEYNKDIENVNDESRKYKKMAHSIKVDLQAFCERNCRDCDEKPKTATCHLSVYPDIIVHERGYNRNNLLIIEVKKSNRNGMRFDHKKLENYTTSNNGNLNYRYGLFLEFEVGNPGEPNRPTMVWFSNGAQRSREYLLRSDLGAMSEEFLCKA